MRERLAGGLHPVDNMRESSERALLRLLGLAVFAEAFEAIEEQPTPRMETYDRHQMEQEQRVAHAFLASGFYRPWDEAAGLDPEVIRAEYRRRMEKREGRTG